MESVRKPSATASKAKVSEGEDSDVRPYDILCGRSKTCFNNIGNRRFRITISMNLKKYDTLSSRSEKSKYIFNLARTLKEDVGFRFVHISKFGRVELTDEQIRAKIGHALRDLSKAQKEAAAVAARPLRTDEAQKIIESSKSPVPTKIQSSKAAAAAAKVVTPEPLPRRVTNDFEAGIEAKLMMALPSCPDIRKEAMMDSQQDVPHAIFFSSQQQQQDIMLPIAEEASNLTMPPSNRKPAPAPIAAAATKEDAVDEDDFCLMPLRFDQPECHGMLDPIPLDVLPAFADIKMPPKARSISMPNISFAKEVSAFVMDDDEDDDLGSICSVPYNDEVVPHQQPRYDDGPYHPRKTRASFPMHHQHHHQHQQSHHPDLMSMGSDDDDHMISLCESVDCLSLDLGQDVHA